MVGYHGLQWNKIFNGIRVDPALHQNFFRKKKENLNDWKFYTVHRVEMLKRYVALILPTNQTEFGF